MIRGALSAAKSGPQGRTANVGRECKVLLVGVSTLLPVCGCDCYCCWWGVDQGMLKTPHLLLWLWNCSHWTKKTWSTTVCFFLCRVLAMITEVYSNRKITMEDKKSRTYFSCWEEQNVVTSTTMYFYSDCECYGVESYHGWQTDDLVGSVNIRVRVARLDCSGQSFWHSFSGRRNLISHKSIPSKSKKENVG